MLLNRNKHEKALLFLVRLFCDRDRIAYPKRSALKTVQTKKRSSKLGVFSF